MRESQDCGPHGRNRVIAGIISILRGVGPDVESDADYDALQFHSPSKVVVGVFWLLKFPIPAALLLNCFSKGPRMSRGWTGRHSFSDPFAAL